MPRLPLPFFAVKNDGNTDDNEARRHTAPQRHRIAGRILAWSLCGGENEQRRSTWYREAAAATKIAINSNYFHKGKEKEVPDVSELADDGEDHEPYYHNGTISSPLITAN